MFNLMGYGASLPFNFDIDGDGIPDCYAEYMDIDGDGTVDTLALDFDGDGVFDSVMMDVDVDGDGIVDGIAYDFDADGLLDEIDYDLNHDGAVDGIVSLIDTDGDGNSDTIIAEYDVNGDGITDLVEKSYDYDQDGNIDYSERFEDTNGDGTFDVLTKLYDWDSDGTYDNAEIYVDEDGDGVADMMFAEEYLDTDGDGAVDTLIRQIDFEADGTFDALEVYDVDEATGALTLIPIDYTEDGVTVDELGHFDPDKADPDDVIGDPGEAMELWECQGQTGRCALFAQKFIIEEMTGQEIDIEDLVDLAEENGWFTEEGGTMSLNLNKLLDYFGIDNEMTFHNDVDDLVKCLSDGGKAIVSIDADEIWYGETDDMFVPADSANHAVEVIGIDNSDPDHPMVILNDSGHEGGCGEMVPLDTFIDAWEDSGFQMITCM